MRSFKERTTARIGLAGRISHHEMRRISQSLLCTPSPPYLSLQIHQFSIHKPTPSHPEEELPRVGAQQNHPVTPLTMPLVFSARVIELMKHPHMETIDKHIILCLHARVEGCSSRTGSHRTAWFHLQSLLRQVLVRFVADPYRREVVAEDLGPARNHVSQSGHRIRCSSRLEASRYCTTAISAVQQLG